MRVDIMGYRKKIPLPVCDYQLIIVCVGTSHPGNLGAICRSMLNFGFDKLRLVNPKCETSDSEAKNRAKHAGEVLAKATVYDSLSSAVKDCSLVVGTSGKREVGNKTSFRHYCFPWELSEKFSSSRGKIALVFGSEGVGLSTEDLFLCDFLATIPTWEGYPIANFAHSVNSFLYQIHSDRVVKLQGKVDGIPDIVPLVRELKPELRATVLAAISEFSMAIPGNQERKTSLQNTLTRMLMMSAPTENEVTRLIGGLIDATTSLQYSSGDENWLNNRRKRIE